MFDQLLPGSTLLSDDPNSCFQVWVKKKSLGLLCKDTRSDLDVYTYMVQWKALLYLNELNQKHLCLLSCWRAELFVLPELCTCLWWFLSLVYPDCRYICMHVYIYITLHMPRDYLHQWIPYYIWFRLYKFIYLSKHKVLIKVTLQIFSYAFDFNIFLLSQ